MNRAYDVKDFNLAYRNKAREIIDRVDNEVPRPNVYNQVTIEQPKELSPGYLSNPANRGMDNKDQNLQFLNTSRYRKNWSPFFDTGVSPGLNEGNTAKMFFDRRLMF